MFQTESPQEDIHLSVTDVYSGDFEVGSKLVIEILKVMRFLPTRRRAIHGLCRDKEYMVKVFFPHRKQLRDIRRETRSALLLTKHQILTPRLLAKSETDEGDIVLIYEFLHGTRVLSQVIESVPEEELIESLSQLVVAHGRQHELGAYQYDDHLANYLWDGSNLYVIDTGSILVKKAPLVESKRVSNMAKLLANSPYRLHAHMNRLMGVNESFGESVADKEAYLRKINDRLAKEVRVRIARYMRKTRRGSEEFEHVSDTRQEWHAWREMAEADRDAFLTDPTGSSIEGYVSRQFPKQSALGRVVSGKRHPEALNEWSMGHALLDFKIPTARPMLCVLKGYDLSFDYLVIERIPGTLLSEMTQEDLSKDDGHAARELSERLMELASAGVNYEGVKVEDFVLREDGVLAINNVSGLSLDGSLGDVSAKTKKLLAGVGK